jgi:hypothetical protein
MTNEDLESRRFWEKIIGLVILASVILLGVVTYFIVRVCMALGINIGTISGTILTLVIIAGPIAYINNMLHKELDKRFPPFDANNSHFPTFRGEINYNYQQSKKD